MLEKPEIQESTIVACLLADFGLQIVDLVFLPIGADLNTVVYRAVAYDAVPYFVKLRRGVFDSLAVTLPRYLSDQGLQQIISPLPTRTGQLWADLDPYKVIVYPFIKGCNGYEVAMAAHHWGELGAALQCLHTMVLPPELMSCLQYETYSAQWRMSVLRSLELVERGTWADPVAADLAAFVHSRQELIQDLVQRADRLAHKLQARAPEWVVCHTDLHAGNILIGANDNLYIVDWDNPLLAFKERDLMFPGGAQGFSGHTPEQEETLFYQGYGPTQVDRAALAYYRYERIIQDIAIYCELLLLTDAGGEDRAQSLLFLKSNFQPNNTIEIAYRADQK